MSSSENHIVEAAEKFIINFFQKHITAEYVYHDLQHTINVVAAVSQLAEGHQLSQPEIELLQIAAWFHDSGYDQGPEDHEQRSSKYAAQFLNNRGFPAAKIEIVKRIILATKVPHQAQDLLEEIICDADLSHLGEKTYWDRCGRVRQELLMTKSIVMSEQEWVNFELDFMNRHRYYTVVAEEKYNGRKLKHIKQLRKQKLRLNPKAVESVEDLARQDKKKKRKKKKIRTILPNDKHELKELNLGRGVETMFRAAYRTHVNLSSIADNKANIMLSINAIIISIVLPQLVPQFSANPHLVAPTIILLTVCLVSMIFATLSTRPKITEGKYSKEDIETRKANLLFFGNFYNMRFDDFHWGMMEMIKDSDYLYSSMTKDLYYLGVVLAKKYRYLSICYTVFMYGMIAAVLSFAIFFML